MWKCLIFFVAALTSSLDAQINVMAFAGSTRNDSVNKKLIIEAADIARELGANVTLIDLKDYPMPLFDGDLEAAEGMPENAKKMRQLMFQSQVVLIASPEYNHSIPAVLKNFLDWISRNEKAERSREAYLGKKFAIMSASPGKGGGAKGLIHLRDILLDQRGIVIEQQVSISDAYNAFDEKGRLKDQEQRTNLEQLVQDALN